MSLVTATMLSFKNLLTKRGRTISTSFAGSIGIIGVALVLALSSGLSAYIDRTQSDTLAGFPITISTNEQTMIGRGPPDFVDIDEETSYEKYPDKNIIYSYDEEIIFSTHKNIIKQEYLDYIGAIPTELPDAVNNISYTHEVNINLLARAEDATVRFNTLSAFSQMEFGQIGVGDAYWQELPEHDEFILSIYDLIGEGSRMPTSKNEVVLVVDEYNRIDKEFFEKIGITNDVENYKLIDFTNQTFLKVILNDNYYSKNKDLY